MGEEREDGVVGVRRQGLGRGGGGEEKEGGGEGGVLEGAEYVDHDIVGGSRGRGEG